jgi:predicted DNA-binding transcriptional regulator YafY
MILFRKRSKQKAKLAKKEANEQSNTKRCPSCGELAKLAESGKDRETYFCEACSNTSTFTHAPANQIDEPKVKKMSTMTLRDRSSKSKQKMPKAVAELKKDEAASVTTIREGMESTSLLAFEYQSSDGKRSSRMVEPYKLTKKNGEIILYGYDTEAGGIRTFKLKAMSFVEKQSFSFKPRWDIEDTFADARKESSKKEKDNS